MPATAKAPRTAAQLQALRRYAMTWAWDQAYHFASYYRPGAVHVQTEARKLLARGWVEAKLAEKHGHLEVLEAAAEVAAPAVSAARPIAFIPSEIEDLENRDRLGAFGLGRLSALRAELHAAKLCAH